MLWRSIGSLRLFQGVRSFSSAVESPSMKQTSWTRRVLLALGVSTIGSGAYVLSREDSYDINTYLGITQRYTRIGWTMLKISGAYQYALWSNQHADQYLFDAEIRKVHLYAARCLLDMCLANKGMFIKAGQYIASQTLLLPAEYTDTLALLQDKVPSRPWSEIEVTLQKEFGNNYMSTRFESIEQKPIAAGSLAQVHRGLTKDGREVAIKIQYEDVKASFSTDMKFIETVVTFYSKMFPQFNFQWLLNEFEADIPQEINFVKEGENAERLIKLFQKDPRLKIPEIYWEHTTERVLTMEFIGGNVCKLVDKDSFKKMGFSEKQVCEVLVDVFCTQAFEHGFVHADPHPGNILVRPRKDKPTEPQLVLLDHGLYRTMDDEFSSMSKGYHSDFTLEDHRRLQKEVSNRSQEILSILSSVPQELILVLKINNYLASLDVGLGTPVNTFRFILSHCVRSVCAYRNKHWKTTILLTNSHGIDPFFQAFKENMTDRFGVVCALWLWIRTSLNRYLGWS